MKTCKKFRQWIWLAVYEELPADQKRLLDAHLQSCPECQLDSEEAQKARKLFDQKVQIEPTDIQLNSSRAELHRRLVFVKHSQTGQNWLEKIWQIVSLDFSPIIRVATAAALLIIGILLGKVFFQPAESNFIFDQKQLSPLDESNISNIESIQYNPITKQVSIKLSTMRDVVIEGDLEKPAIQRLLAETLVRDDRPNIRLKTVRALEQSLYMNKNLLVALAELIAKEENPGIRLKAVKLLTSIPIAPSFKELLARVLVRVLLNDSNSAIRIEAFKGLSKMGNGTVAPVIFNVAKDDSSEYIRSRAKQILERTENPTYP